MEVVVAHVVEMEVVVNNGRLASCQCGGGGVVASTMFVVEIWLWMM